MPDRFYLPRLSESGTVTLEGHEAHHLMHVLRVRTGEIVELFDGQGLVAAARVVGTARRDATLQILESHRDAHPAREVIVATAVPKGDRFDWLIEKATELGVTAIVPLVTSRSTVDPRESKLDKLRQTVVSACKQSGRNHLLDLRPVMTWAEFVRNEIPQRTTFIAHPISESSDSTRLVDPAPIQFAIGPEGGFTEEEVSGAIAAGATPINLGSQILRIETAAIALAARVLIH